MLCNACHVAPRAPGTRNTWCRACKSEWQRQYRAGVRKQVRVPAPIRDANGCLIWQGYIDGNGYGRLTADGRATYAHIEAFKTAGGLVDEINDTVDHLCEIKHCVEPSHLESCPRGENTQRYYERRKVAV